MTEKQIMEVWLKEIDKKDETFCLSYPVFSSHLALFLKETGFLFPLLLRKKKRNKRYQIVSGFRRMAALNSQGGGKTPAFVFSERELSNKKAILLNFYENISRRQFNEIEKSLAIGKLRSLGKVQEEKLINFYLPLLGLPPSRKFLDNYLLLNQLEDWLKEALAKREMSLEVGIVLAMLRPRERKLFVKLIKRFNLNQNKTKIIIGLLEEISRRDRKSIHSLLWESSKKNFRDFSGFRDYLTRRRYPEFKAYEKNFLDLIKSLKLPPEIKVIPPPFFERASLKIILEAKEEKKLKEILSILNRVSRNKKFGKLLSML